MAIPVARVHLAMAHAALPALLPTPPKWKNILPMSSPPKPSRGDAVERWDAHKTVKPASPASSSSGSSKRTTDGKSSSSGRASSSSSCEERWDSNKKSATSSSSSSGSLASRASSGDKWHSNKRRPVGRASSAERWDEHKKHRAPQQQQQQAADAIDHDDGQSSTGSNDMELYAGPGFIGAPEPSMLPMPTSLMVPVAA